ncbi:collagen triple helix repeat protein [Nostoc sp. PCC 7524]|uniref:hypothetical protein n=1 Tax=Nostoc sp. (strain ATCC 29411 / PCC 7524) TaxID=28072 RepID=UPI00029EF472|nr:hypothetical protein [Nostoc sp. PCC 7524]AFY48899.1 collagen triple helix repeat protein [Nostoc sp. PCC 7524]
MSTASTISNLQQALNCAGKCDCCNQLNQRINQLESRINAIKPVDENAIVKRTEAAIMPQLNPLVQAIAAGVVIKELKPVKQAVGLLDDAIYTLRGQVYNVGVKAANAVSKAEGAVKTAGSALGLSNQAMSQIGKLTGQVAQLFSLIATIANLALLIGTINTLGGRVDAVEKTQQGLSDSISQVIGRIIPPIRGTANEAKATAQSAFATAKNVDGKANTAINLATNAIGTANSASGTANIAITNASTAQATANKADQKAGTAQQAAIAANKTSNNALEKAGLAFGLATTTYGLLKLLQNRPGIPGRPGRDGRNGVNGRDGRPGRDGARGLQGIPGRPGINGINGIDGRPGLQGIPGRRGEPGFPGANGRPGINGRDGRDVNPADLADIKARLAAIQSGVNNTQSQLALGFANILAKLKALADLALLKPIYAVVLAIQTVLGGLITFNNTTYTISGFLLLGFTKCFTFFKWAILDRVLNLMTTAATIHNALMLSNDIGQTLAASIANVLVIFGIKDSDGQAYNISEIIGSNIENFIKGLVGESNYAALSLVWAKANRIYQATTNVLNSFLSLSQVILQANELIAAYTGKIGNALKRGGVVLENAYGWMNPQPKFNRVSRFLENVQNAASTVQMVTQVPLDMVNATTELTNASTEFVKAIKEDDKPENKSNDAPDPDVLKAQELLSKNNSQPIAFDFSDLFDGDD